MCSNTTVHYIFVVAEAALTFETSSDVYSLSVVSLSSVIVSDGGTEYDPD